ncbi:Hsp20/alpha crystallin family protein [Streptomyces sp. Li-HN-5-11]|uniref:Hsp20/alpha crystallin family protein n=1 Tax=Streptomyces sp. Li-HN-5-11 TaxID=3075432 RepID=UPI0028AFC3F2|nr:Hsp20/alpha crystallin family protein [Streptomyces sp. Li-HN-5-11]WNM32100.1 Hsp20/alpha crystallin family protein [Streptomyces sp. Li-HN-5-11]WOP39133.1 Hsp20/alpha crystallin family protein [Streptomyces sp. Li-HN-5-13]
MTLPVRHRAGSLLGRAFPAGGWNEPAAAEFDELWERMNRLMESAAAAPAGLAWSPAADMRETDDAYVIEAELPGVKRDDIDIEMSDREVRIKGTYKEQEREGVLRRGTRRTGSFEYHAVLPADVKAEEAGATLSDGVLTVTLPKAQAAKPRRIEITGS